MSPIASAMIAADPRFSRPDKSALRSDLTNKFVDVLFTSLQHPPLSYLSDDFKYRMPDGSNSEL